jgi:hypothetical protein
MLLGDHTSALDLRPMTADDRPQKGTLKITSAETPKAMRELPPIERMPFRSLEELEPVARQILLDRSLMQRFRDVMGSQNDDRCREMVDEVRRIAQTIDTSISYAEGASVTLCLMQIVRDQDEAR